MMETPSACVLPISKPGFVSDYLKEIRINNSTLNRGLPSCLQQPTLPPNASRITLTSQAICAVLNVSSCSHVNLQPVMRTVNGSSTETDNESDPLEMRFAVCFGGAAVHHVQDCLQAGFNCETISGTCRLHPNLRGELVGQILQPPCNLEGANTSRYCILVG